MAIPNLKGKCVLVTGAASGIGRATALAFARRGACVIATDIRADALHPLAQEIAALGERCIALELDVTKAEAVQALARRVERDFGALDVLINNAGIAYLGRFLDADIAHWQRVMDVNLMGVVHGCHAFIPAMLAAGGARHVINVASAAGIYPSPTMASYAASKHAVTGLSEVLKMELAGSNVSLSTVFPGVINTPIVGGNAQAAPSVTRQQLDRLQQYYLKEGCDPSVVGEDMVQAVLQGRDMVLSGPYARLIYHLRRISVKLLRRVVLGSAYKVGYL